MIASSSKAKSVALIAAVSVHVGVLMAFAAKSPEPMTEGGGGSAEVRLGSSFADMVQGTLTSEPTETVTPTETEVEAAQQPQPEMAEPVETPRAEVTPPITPTPVAPVTAAPTVPVPSEAPKPPTETAEAVQPTEPIEATPEPAEQFSALRPPTRPTPPKPKPKPVTQAKPKPKAPSPAGNAQQNATRGTASGAEKAQAASRGSGTQSSETGSAAASNYPGLVYRCLSRVPRPRSRGKLSARVTFSITANGRVTGVALLKSSGQPLFDKQVVDLVKRAGPCPAPPPGARRDNYSVLIEGR